MRSVHYKLILAFLNLYREINCLIQFINETAVLSEKLRVLSPFAHLCLLNKHLHVLHFSKWYNITKISEFYHLHT